MIDKLFLCIDPGVSTGVARMTLDGTAGSVQTYEPLLLLDELRDLGVSYRLGWIVLFEDSRKTSNFFTPKRSDSKKVFGKIAGNVGEINQLCRLIEARCLREQIEHYGISPLQKGKKVNAEQFKQALPRFAGKSNQHERDAAMLWFARPMHLRGKNAGN